MWIEILSKGVVPGHGENPINFVSVTDVAETVERAVLDDTNRGEIIEVCGPLTVTSGTSHRTSGMSPRRK